MTGENQKQTPETDVYAVFCSSIDQASVQRILNGVALATQNQVKHLHILFQSIGGFIGDGICLYNFLRTCPIDVTIYNAGSVQSIATVGYLGAKYRKASTHSTFMLHRSMISPQLANTDKLQSATRQLAIDDKRIEAILREHLQISADDWTNLRNNEFWFTAEDAAKNGLVTSLGEFAPPKGSRLYVL
jgi:ATP-dependent Clp protease protease subunit